MFSRRDAPELCYRSSLPSKQRVQGRPGARCTRGLMCKVVQKGAHEHTGSAESIRPSLRNGFTAYAVISPATNSVLSPSLTNMACLSPVGPTRLRQLGISNGCQNHTVLPYAATRLRQEASPGIGIGRLHAADRSRAKLALPSRVTPDAAASTASHPAFVTIMIRPSVGWDVDGYGLIWTNREVKYFRKTRKYDLTGFC